jgi:hypothetical protein
VNFENNQNITLYPNIIRNNKVSLRFNNMQEGTYHIRCISSTGQMITAAKLIHTANDVQHDITIPFVAPGTYHIEINGEQGRKVVSFVRM